MGTSDTAPTNVPADDGPFVLEIKNIKINGIQEEPADRCCPPIRKNKFYVVMVIEGLSRRSKAVSPQAGNVHWEETLSFNSVRRDSPVVITVIRQHKFRKDTPLNRSEEMVVSLFSTNVAAISRAVPPLQPGAGLDLQIQFTAIASPLRDYGRSQIAQVEQLMGQLSLGQHAVAAASHAEGAISGIDQVAASVSDNQDIWQSLINKLGRLCEAADAVSEVRPFFLVKPSLNKQCQIHPYAKMALTVISAGLKVVVHGAERDQKILDLVSTMHDTFNFVEDAQPLPDCLKHQKDIILQMLRQSIECGYFIQKYAKDQQFFIRALKNISSNADDLRDRFKASFSDLQQKFGQNATLQVQLVSVQILNDLTLVRKQVSRIELSSIPYAAGASLQSSKACLPGTREALLDTILAWINSEDSPQRILLLTGGAGTGKSTVAHTVGRYFKTLDRLGSSFCFSRDQPSRDPGKLFSTIAVDLAYHSPAITESLLNLDAASRTTQDMVDQFQTLLASNMQNLAMLGPTVIAIDALDESGDARGRKAMLDIFATRAKDLPGNIRIILTSRPEEDVMRILSTSPYVQTMVLEDVQDTQKDIDTYIRYELLDDKSSISGKLSDLECKMLSHLSGGLFQWAFVACDIIKGSGQGGRTIRERYSQIIDSKNSVLQPLDQLYSSILKTLFDMDDQDTKRRFHRIMGHILIAHEPLSMESLCLLLQEEDAMGKIRSIVGYLGSLLYGIAEDSKPIRPLHTSFRDFLCDMNRSGVFYINAVEHHQSLWHESMGLIKRDLHFNCGQLKTSYRPNSEQSKGWPKSDTLKYACSYWGYHFEEIPIAEKGKVLQQIKDFLESKLLFWFEALSILGKVNIAYPVLMQLAECYKDSDLGAFSRDAARFILYFGAPIATSAPHIYLSSLPFSPRASLVARHYLSHLACSLTVELGPLETWPQMIMQISGHKDHVSCI
ncbi:hypothetical protein OE88DRAFT_1807559, partial [Heliocybe sulcata]